MRRFVLLFIISIFTLNLAASHFIGGEITWQCDNDPLSPNYGQYTFYMHIYQDCDGIDFSFGNCSEYITVHNNPALAQICMNFLDTNDISSTGVSGSVSCYNCDNQPNNQFGAVREWIYVSDPITINGTPPAAGWHFTWGDCCRSGAIINTPNASGAYWTVRSVMYPYTDASGTIFPNGNMCHDNSPIFKEKPKSLLCTGYPFSYSHLAFDVELDSLSYSWAEPLGDNFLYDPNNPSATALAFTLPYAVNSPIPGNPTLNNENGEISFNSNIAGVFITCVKVAAFKCGQVVAEVFRDVNVALISCGTLPNGAQNLPPVITAPVGSQNWITNLNLSTGLPSYETTIMAGELVTYSVVATDNDINAIGNMQDLTLEVEGGQLDPLLALSNPAIFTVTSSSPGFVSGDFLWESNCDHMQDYGCGRQGGAYTFNLKAYDDFCPANGIVIATITINVIPPQPDLRCLAVDATGGVDLFYSFPQGIVDTNIKYDIYYGNQFGGPYSLLDSTFFPDTNYYHAGPDADISKKYYFLLGSVSCGTNIGGSSDSLLYSDTLSTILMNAMVINSGNTGDLEWNPIHNPLLISSSSDYELHYINANNSDNIIAVLPDTVYQMDGDNCDYFPQFYVEISDISGCISRSSIGSVHLLDTVSPIIPIITDVSVDANGKSVISWIPVLGADKYVIYFLDNTGIANTIDTVLGELNSSYSYDGSFAYQYSETFSIRALDSCGNTKNTTPYHNSIYLEVALDACTYDLTLNWNAYINWDADVSYYDVVIEETDLSGFTTALDTNLQNITNYVISDVKNNFSYKIHIVANDGDTIFSAISNQLVLVANLNKKPEFNYIEYASINHDNDFVEINCLVDNMATINHYNVMRSLQKENNFIKIGEIPFTGTTTVHYTDEEAKTSKNFYQYQIYPIDPCGIQLSAPPINMTGYLNDTSFAQTILLETAINLDYSNEGLYTEEYTNTLNFSEYDKWLGDVSEYRLYRSINSQPFSLLPIYIWDRTDDNNEPLQFIDVVTEYGDGNGRFCYYIEAVEGSTTPYSPEGSFSNVSCVSQTPIIFIPSVFTPNGDNHNEVFHPVTYYVSEEGYSFTIYTRTGEKIFTTNNPLKGWDGTFNGNIVQDGNYVYHLQYINGVGDLTEKTDIIILVR